ncbi:putative DNA-binding domain-containing protein [Variovorax sp. YR752]|uniref:HvfC/BufC family peptide modification chaperone n=1 Tax=Variovorax sp. YR752 TaxID=1884383 RepID=UPI0031377F46
MSVLVEAQRQQQLLAAILRHDAAPALREQGARAERGLAAYRANAGALAERALAAAAPTVAAMLGEESFARLARELWAAHPPRCGDVAEWGAELPAWLAAQADLAEWPWLADAARLDLALHAAERAADATLEVESLSLLAEADPASVTLNLMPGLAVLASTWPIASIHAAHHDAGPDPFAPVRVALAAGQGEAVCVARAGWRAVVHRLLDHDAAFMRALQGGDSLAGALHEAGEGFDFGAWLPRAIAQSWLKAVLPLADTDGSNPERCQP